MNDYLAIILEKSALEKAAKYICTLKCGLCPMVEEGFSCKTECDTETRPWRCWVEFFKETTGKDKVKAMA